MCGWFSSCSWFPSAVLYDIHYWLGKTFHFFFFRKWCASYGKGNQEMGKFLDNLISLTDSSFICSINSHGTSAVYRYPNLSHAEMIHWPALTQLSLHSYYSCFFVTSLFYFIYVFIYSVCGHVCHSIHIKIGGQFAGIRFFSRLLRVLGMWFRSSGLAANALSTHAVCLCGPSAFSNALCSALLRCT